MRFPTFPSCLACFLVLAIPASGDWRQFRGPNFDGSAQGAISREWPPGGPPLIWKRPIRSGFSSFVLADNTLCTLVLRSLDGAKVEACIALDANTGRELWLTHLTPAKYTGAGIGVGYDSGDYGAPGNRGGDGPRSTPAMDDHRVYVMSSALTLFCLDSQDGKILWQHDILREHAGLQIYYENAASPLIVGNVVLVAGGGPGQSILAFDKVSGEIVWKGLDEQLTHSTPTRSSLHGVRQAIFYTRTGLVSLRPADGHVLWRFKFPYRVCAAISPVVAADLVYCSSGYGIGSGVCKVSLTTNGFSTSEVWRLRHNEPVANYWSTPIHKDGHIYGMFGFKKFHTAPMKCVDLKTGDVLWAQPNFGHGNVIRIGDLLLAQTGYGDIVLIDPSPESYKELARSKVLSGKCWSTPIFSDGLLYIRSSTEAACVDLSREFPTEKPLNSAGNLPTSKILPTGITSGIEIP
jgi:outer membrane protein assembly factor BamB